MDTQPIKLTYKKSLVAFIDILGFSDLVNGSNSDPEKRKKVEKIVNFVKDIIFVQEKVLRPDDPFYLQVSFISDSIVISTDAPRSVNDSRLINVLKYAGSVSLSLLAIGVLCRGSIVIGNIFHHRESNFNTVVGSALVNAYKSEKSVAIYPRIVIDDATYKLWEEYLSNELDPEFWKEMLKLDQDGEWFINIFHRILLSEIQFLFPHGPESDDILNQAGNWIIDGLNKSNSQKYSIKTRRVCEKYNWLLNQYLPYASADFKKLVIK